MKASNFPVLTLMVCALGACSSTDSEQKNKLFDYKSAAVKVRSLEVPPDLTAPSSSDRYGIPGTEGDGVARYSDYSKGRPGMGSNMSPEARNVLPEARSARLMRNDTQRWLLVNDKAENIWPVVKAFWQENGLAIKSDNPQAGIVETDWAENLAENPRRGWFAGGTPGKLDQYHTRLERSQDGNSTSIYIKHSGQQKVQEYSGNSLVDPSYKWLPRANDPELEATMLQLLMAKLASGATVAAEAQQSAAPVQAQTPEQKPAAAKLQTLADGSKSILLSEPFDKGWRKVSLALEQAGIALEDKDRSKGIFFLRAAKNKDASNQVNVHESGGGCEVTVSDGKGVSTPDTQRIIDTLYQALVKQ